MNSLDIPLLMDGIWKNRDSNASRRIGLRKSILLISGLLSTVAIVFSGLLVSGSRIAVALADKADCPSYSAEGFYYRTKQRCYNAGELKAASNEISTVGCSYNRTTNAFDSKGNDKCQEFYDAIIADARGKLKTSHGDLEFRLIGINHDDKADGTGKAGLTFQAAKLWNNTSLIPMNYLNKNDGGWRDSNLRSFLNLMIYIDSNEFRKELLSVNKQTNNVGNLRQSYTVYNSKGNCVTIDDIWLASPAETYSNAYYYSGYQYEYYNIKGVTTTNYENLKSERPWRLRSPNSYGNMFSSIYKTGALSTIDSVERAEMSPCFSF